MLNLTGYIETNLLYSGSRTLVYRAVPTTGGEPVVIKVLRNSHPNFNELVQFRNQYLIARHLSHPAILRPLALERYGNGYALLMPDEGAVSLWDYWQQRERALPEFLAIAIQLAEAMQYLNQERIIHKDIKPSNILIHPETHKVKLIDFSISSLLPKEQQQLANPKVLEGTLAYISPEQTGRMNRGIDYRTDFYSLGATFFELLTGKLPFETTEPMELVHCHLAQAFQFPGSSEVPLVLQAIVKKLMAKNAEDRYQSALGLKRDLERCLQEWEATGEITTFEIGERDLSDRFLIPEKLYGRETEVQTLLDAFGRVSEGNGELLLVAGYSGVGKTAVVNEAHKPITEKRGYFIKGKYDQFQRNIPFSAFVIAFRDLMGQLLSESDTQLEQWRCKILDVVGENGQVIIEVIPELEKIIGKQPPVPQLEGSAAENRFNLLFPKFVAVFTSKEHPLVIFIDDLQWADSASLNLLKLLTNQSERGYLLVLGAYRNNEVFPAHPLVLTLKEIEQKNARVETLTLTPLDKANINRLVADTLLCSTEVAAPLSELVYQKTKGNPFFITQFLKGLHGDGWITFEFEAGYWQCDLAQVRQLALTDDVVEFMVGRLHKLPVETQDVLKLAACIGAEFDLTTLAVVCQEDRERVAADLWRALQEDFVIPKSQTYKFFQGEENEAKALEEVTVGYRFLHDRVQQAAYTLIPEDQKQTTHLQIGRLWLQNTAPEELQDKLFSIVNQLNIGVDLIAESSQIQEFVRLNRMAGNKATAATAYEAAIGYFNIALQFLTPEDWTQQHDLAIALHLEAAKAEYLGSNFERSHALLDVVLRRARTLLEEIHAYEQKIEIYLGIPQPKEAIDMGLHALELLGVELEEEAPKTLDVEVLSNLPPMTEPERLAVLRVLNLISPAAFVSDPTLTQQIIFTGVHYGLEYGNSALAGFFYAIFGAKCAEIELGYQLGQFGVNLVEEFDDRHLKSIIQDIFNGELRHWKEHLRSGIEPLRETFYCGLENGELIFSGYAILHHCSNSLLAGESLEIVKQKHDEYLELLQKQKLEYHVLYGQVWHQLAFNLLGLAEDHLQFAGPMLNEAEIVPVLVQQQNGTTLFALHSAKSMLLYLFNAPERALASAREAETNKLSAGGFFTFASHNFYYSLILLALYPDATDAVREEYLGLVATNQQEMQKWAIHASTNFQHKFDLVEAERYRLLGETYRAIEYYDRAISGAKENEYVQEEALGNELAAQLYLKTDKEDFARSHLIKAYYGYARWGSKAKVKQLERQHSEILTPILQSDRPSVSSGLTISKVTSVTHTSTMSSVSTILDFSSLLKASQTLSGEIQLEGLLSTLMDVIVQSAGATKGALLLVAEGGLTVEAMARTTPQNSLEIDTLGQSIPLEQSQELPVGLINYVRRTTEMALLDANAARIQFGGDTYIIRNSPQSLLCLPLLGRRESMPENSNRLIGILYLENTVTADAFTNDRLELLNALCAQAAISLENARLYQQAQQALTNLQDAQLQLVQNEKMATLGNLVAGVAHEINNPLTFISGNVEISQGYLEDISSVLERYREEHSNPSTELTEEIEERDLDFVLEDFPQVIASMETGVERIRNISISLRTFSRTDTDAKTELNLRDGLESTLLILKYRLKANDERPGIEVVKNYGDVPPIQCYPGQLNQVFMNLLANAIDAMEEGNAGRSFNEIKANPNRISIQTYLYGEWAVVKIADNGTGMPEEVKAKIFDQGFTTKAVGKGTGLGMAISYQIVVEKHGGRMTCDSRIGFGATFTILLPIRGEGGDFRRG